MHARYLARMLCDDGILRWTVGVANAVMQIWRGGFVAPGFNPAGSGAARRLALPMRVKDANRPGVDNWRSRDYARGYDCCAVRLRLRGILRLRLRLLLAEVVAVEHGVGADIRIA